MKSFQKKVESGYVLLEALIALLIFSLGLLGMIGFQAASFKIVTDSRFRTEAAMLADELLARMSASPIVSVEADYGPQGPKFRAWLNDRVIGVSRLPGVQVIPRFSASAISDRTRLVSLRIEWTNPGSGDSNASVGTTGIYETRAMIF